MVPSGPEPVPQGGVAPSASTLPTHGADAPSAFALPTHGADAPSASALSTHGADAPCAPALSTHGADNPVRSTPYDAYDAFAWAYDLHWGDILAGRIMPLLDRHVLAGLETGASVLDLCCGTGQLAERLLARGLQTTGLDGSAAMLALARARAPAAAFVHADARSFDLPGRFDAVVCAFDSLNHILEPEGVDAAFRCVHASLKAAGGVFLCDFNTSAAYDDHWDDAFHFTVPDHVVVARAHYDRVARIGHFDATLFRPADMPPGDRGGRVGDDRTCWLRTDVHLTQRPYDVDEICRRLNGAGFADVQAFEAEADLGWVGHTGRAFFLARRRTTQATGT